MCLCACASATHAAVSTFCACAFVVVVVYVCTAPASDVSSFACDSHDLLANQQSVCHIVALTASGNLTTAARSEFEVAIDAVVDSTLSASILPSGGSVSSLSFTYSSPTDSQGFDRQVALSVLLAGSGKSIAGSYWNVTIAASM